MSSRTHTANKTIDADGAAVATPTKKPRITKSQTTIITPSTFPQSISVLLISEIPLTQSMSTAKPAAAKTPRTARVPAKAPKAASPKTPRKKKPAKKSLSEEKVVDCSDNGEADVDTPVASKKGNGVEKHGEDALAEGGDGGGVGSATGGGNTAADATAKGDADVAGAGANANTSEAVLVEIAKAATAVLENRL